MVARCFDAVEETAESEEGSGSCSLTTASTAEEVAVEVRVILSGFSCSCLVLFGLDCETLKAVAEEVVEVASVVAVSCYWLIRRHYHRNVDGCYFLLFVSSFSFAGWRELKPKHSLSLSSRCSSFARSYAPIAPSPTASEEPEAERGSS